MNRTKRTAANAIAQIVSVFVQSLLVLIVTREIITNIGSDYNGITSIATQLLTFLSLIEGGFTLASLVKLYKPYNDDDFGLINKYLSLSNKKFKQIGWLYLLVGIAISLAYTPFIKTSASFEVAALIMVFSVISSAFNVYYVSKYRLLYQVYQSEYIIYIIQTIMYCLMYTIEIIVIRKYNNIIYARICVAFFQIVTGLIIGIVAKKRFDRAVFNVEYDGVEITGTSDVFVSKICALVYSSASVLFISTFIGTEYTSVYAVYNYVLAVISNVINAFLVAPRNALGQLLNGNSSNKLEEVFNEYEFISILSMTILYSVAFALIIPFVRLYTNDIADVNYVDSNLAILLLLNAVFQMIHIPSGTCLEVSGRFKAVKHIQTAAAIIIIVFSVAGAFVAGIYGILGAKLLTSIFLAIAEISYTRKNILKNKITQFLKISCPSLIIGIAISTIEYVALYNINLSIFTFIEAGCAAVLINSVIILALNYFTNKKYLFSATKRFVRLFKGLGIKREA